MKKLVEKPTEPAPNGLENGDGADDEGNEWQVCIHCSEFLHENLKLSKKHRSIFIQQLFLNLLVDWNKKQRHSHKIGRFWSNTDQ